MTFEQRKFLKLTGFAASVFLVCLLQLSFAGVAHAASTAAVKATNQALGTGINLGNALEAPVEGEWGLTLEAGWFDMIADAGFDSVRVPIRWSAHAQMSPPYRIDSAFFERIDWVLEQTRRTGLMSIINYHHDDALMADPAANQARFLAIWRQIATRYRHQPSSVLFEILNEPHAVFNDEPEEWNRLLRSALRQIRRTNPSRAVLVGPVGYNSISRLADLRLPSDRNLIVSVHYYEPFAFTHQGAQWVSPTPASGVRWFASTTEPGAGVQDWSWDTTLTPGIGRLDVAYQRQYAGFSLHAPLAMQPTRLMMRVRGNLNVSVGCSAGDDQRFVDRVSRANDTWGWIRVDLTECPASTNRVSLMNEMAGPAAFQLGSLRVCAASTCQHLVMNARTAIRQSMNDVRDWGLANDRPMHLGEFGAYSVGDYRSRIRWTRDVATIARQAGLSSAYWEFGAGFGVYNPVTASWRRPLLDALLP